MAEIKNYIDLDQQQNSILNYKQHPLNDGDINILSSSLNSSSIGLAIYDIDNKQPKWWDGENFEGFDTSNLTTTSSFNYFTSSYNTDSSSFDDRINNINFDTSSLLLTSSFNEFTSSCIIKDQYSPSHSLLIQQSGTGNPTSVHIGNNELLGRKNGGDSSIEGLSSAEVKQILNLDQVNNTSDINKPISEATQIALNNKVSLTNITSSLYSNNSSGSFIMLSFNELNNNLPDASSTQRGLVNTGTQTFEGQKTLLKPLKIYSGNNVTGDLLLSLGDSTTPNNSNREVRIERIATSGGGIRFVTNGSPLLSLDTNNVEVTGGALRLNSSNTRTVFGTNVAVKKVEIRGRNDNSGIRVQGAHTNSIFSDTTNFDMIDIIADTDVNNRQIRFSVPINVLSTTQGSLPFPRMTETQRIAISLPATGLMVYQTDGVEGIWEKRSFGWYPPDGLYFKMITPFNFTPTVTNSFEVAQTIDINSYPDGIYEFTLTCYSNSYTESRILGGDFDQAFNGNIVMNYRRKLHITGNDYFFGRATSYNDEEFQSASPTIGSKLLPIHIRFKGSTVTIQNIIIKKIA